MKIKDGDWELINYDPNTGRTIWKYSDGNKTHIRTDYPVENLIKQNSQELNNSDNQRFGDGKRVASIPLNVFQQKLQDAQAQGDSKYISRWLNDSDNRAFRTFKGNI